MRPITGPSDDTWGQKGGIVGNHSQYLRTTWIGSYFPPDPNGRERGGPRRGPGSGTKVILLSAVEPSGSLSSRRYPANHLRPYTWTDGEAALRHLSEYPIGPSIRLDRRRSGSPSSHRIPNGPSLHLARRRSYSSSSRRIPNGPTIHLDCRRSLSRIPERSDQPGPF